MANDAKKVSNLQLALSASNNDYLIIQKDGEPTKIISVGNLLGNSASVVHRANNFISRDKRTPSNSSITIERGTIFYDDNYLYIATSNNVIKRVSLTSF